MRTGGDLVKRLLGPNYDGVSDVRQFIEMASVVVDDASAEAIKRGKPYDTKRAELIERNVAAWYYCIMDPLFTSKSTNGSSGSWQPRSYLDAAKALDPSGALAAIVEPKATVGAKWVGKTCRQ